MASNTKAIRKLYAAEARMNGLELIAYSGQVSFMCGKCGKFWPVTMGGKHECDPAEVKRREAEKAADEKEREEFRNKRG